jgi:hypothetical protein
VTTSEVIVVAVAGTLAAGVLGVLLASPAWRGRHNAPRLVSALLGLHAGGAVVGGAILAGGAVEGWRQDEETASSALLDLSYQDGDGHMYVLLLLFIVATAVATAVLLVVAARSAAGSDTGSRALACAVLGLEIGLCGYALARVVSGSQNAAFVVGVVHLPILMAAMVATWPTHRHLEAAWEDG